MKDDKKYWLLKDIEISEIPFYKRTFKQKIRAIRFYTLRCVLGYIIRFLFGELNKIQRNRNKLKYFTPTIEERFFGNKITWKERKSPLTDEELKNIL